MNLPDLIDIDIAIKKGVTVSAVARFIYDYEPVGAEGKEFRKGLIAALQAANNSGETPRPTNRYATALSVFNEFLRKHGLQPGSRRVSEDKMIYGCSVCSGGCKLHVFDDRKPIPTDCPIYGEKWGMKSEWKKIKEEEK